MNTWPHATFRMIGVLMLMTTGCASSADDLPQACNGVFDFAGIADEASRQDAYSTILQFIELDRNVSLAAAEPHRVWITSAGNRCDDFGLSFLMSQTDAYRGLRYHTISRSRADSE